MENAFCTISLQIAVRAPAQSALLHPERIRGFHSYAFELVKPALV